MGWTVVGQEPSVRFLQRSIESGRIHHAYLFSGPSGVGKRTLARNLAAALNCQENLAAPCWFCPSCRQIQQSIHPDVHWVTPDGAYVKIGQVRQLQRDLSLHSYHGGYKLGVIEQAERLTEEAANSLLKTLEEPGDQTVLILITAFPESLLPTIISRCTEVRLGRVPAALIEREILSQGADPCQARVLTALSDGSLGWAKNALDGEFISFREDLYKELAVLKRLPVHRVLSFSQKHSGKEDVFRTLELMRTWYRDLLMIRVGNVDGIVNFDFRETLREESSHYSVEEITRALDGIASTLLAIRSNINANLALDVLMFQLSGRLTTI